MRSRRAAFSLIFVAGLAATLGLKAQMLDIGSGPDLARFNRDLAALLSSRGYAVSIEDRADDMDLVVADRGACRLKARIETTADRAAARGSFTAGLPVVRYRYRGELLGAFPRGRFDLDNLLGRMAMRLRLASSSQQPLAIAASPACDLERIDFGSQQVFALPRLK